MKRPLLMGILNLTPDSFSGDGVVDTSAAIARFEQLLAMGADIVDLGAESTRPGAVALDDASEWARLEPVLLALRAHPLRSRVQLSVDTYHPQNASRALGVGVDIINDVAGLRADAMMHALVGSVGDIVVMHSLSVPANPAIVWSEDVDPIAEILRWKNEITARAAQFAIDPTRLIFDPGVGFGKTARQSLDLLRRAEMLVASGGRWLVGHSRKSFLKPIVGPDARDEATLAYSALLAQSGVQVLRIHAVARHRAMLDALCM